MAVAKILSHTGKGLYAVELIFNIQRIEQDRIALADKKAELEKELADYETGKADLEQQKIDTEQELNILMVAPLSPLTQQDLKNGVTTKEKKRENELNKLTGKINEFRVKLIEVEEKININQLKYATVILEKKLVDDHSTRSILLEAWCIDYTTTLDVDDYVETTEAFNEYNDPNQYVNVRPITAPNLKELQDKVELTGRLNDVDEILGSENQGELNSLPQVEHVLNSEKWTIAWNWMTQPAMQRWRPYYRVANITTINHTAQTCRISYNNQEYRSSISPFPQGFDFVGGDSRYDVTLFVTHDDVPIEYMHCGSSVFKENDEVIVQYTNRNYTKPVVIGFREKPRRCSIQHLHYINKNDEHVYVEEYGNNGKLAGAPYDANHAQQATGNRVNGGPWDQIGTRVPGLDGNSDSGDIITYDSFVDIVGAGPAGVNKAWEIYINGVMKLHIEYLSWPYPSPQFWPSRIEAMTVYGRIIYLLLTEQFYTPFETPPGILDTPAQTRGLWLVSYALEDDNSLTYLDSEDLFKQYLARRAEFQGDPSNPTIPRFGDIHDQFPVKTYSFSVNSDVIAITFASRYWNTGKIFNNDTNIFVVGASDFYILSYKFLTFKHEINNGVIGFLGVIENETDTMSSDGEINILGSMLVSEQNSDAFFSTGQVNA